MSTQTLSQNGCYQGVHADPLLFGAQGQASDIDIHAREILRMRAQLNEILAHHSGQPVSKIAQDTDRDYILGAGEAKDYGIIDDVLNRRA